LEHNKNYTINFSEQKTKELTFNELKEEFWVPFILKPKDWIGSSWVAKIKDEDELEKYKKQSINQNILVEEFIDWEMYSIDYFVDEKQNIRLSGIVKVELWNKVWVNDFFNLSRIIGEEVEQEINLKKLSIFIKEAIIATWIKNTFIHHEFKLTSKWELKTIELNWRIWGYRLEMYEQWYLLNLLESPFNHKKTPNKVVSNIAIFSIYPTKKWIFKTYNYNLLEKIKKLESFFNLRIVPEKFEWKKVWLTKDWYWKVWWIKLKNKDKNQFKKDCDFIEKNYINLLIIK
jgi:hypothetical protein